MKPSFDVNEKFTLMYPSRFDPKEGDGLIERKLLFGTDSEVNIDKKGLWSCTVKTSDVTHAGTDANVFMVVYGDKARFLAFYSPDQ